MPIGDDYTLTGQVKVSDAEAREHETLIKAKRVMSLPGNQQTRIEYSGSNPIYIGTGPKGLDSSSTGWLLKQITYDGDNPTLIQIAYDSWDNRASASYS